MELHVVTCVAEPFFYFEPEIKRIGAKQPGDKRRVHFRKRHSDFTTSRKREQASMEHDEVCVKLRKI